MRPERDSDAMGPADQERPPPTELPRGSGQGAVVTRGRAAGAFRATDALLGGAMGYLASALVYSLVDLGLGRGLFFASRTLGADLLGEALAASHPLVAALAYDGIRLVALCAAAAVMSAALRQCALRPGVPLLALLAVAPALVLSEGALLLLGRPTSAVHMLGVVIVANVAAAIAIATVVSYRFLLRELHDMARTISGR